MLMTSFSFYAKEGQQKNKCLKVSIVNDNNSSNLEWAMTATTGGSNQKQCHKY